MKLVDILARELKEWPEGVLLAVQDEDGEVKFDNSHELPRLNSSGDVWIRQGGEGDSLYSLSTASDFATAIVTRAEWQAAVDALDIPKFPSDAPVWNGEGLPPIGTVCELRAHKLSEWGRAVIKFASRNVVVWDWEGEPEISGLCTRYAHEVEMRPIRTPEQIAAEERKRITDDIQRVCGDGENNGIPYHEALYQAGYRKQVAP